MVLWGFRWFRLFLNPFQDDDFEHISESDRRIYILGRLEESKFSEWSWVVVVAGVGFFTDAYSIFSINMVVPMLGIIYYGGTISHTHETLLGVVTLAGSIIGQVAFGYGADTWGRRKMYGLELIITIASTLGVVMASNGITDNQGKNGSMSMIVWLLAWRFVLGIGIGADYPLSAVITSEFAPTKLRGKMLTAVFMCQPIGQLAATIVALIATSGQRDGLKGNGITGNTLTTCDELCKRTLDSVWRWIIGVGVIPAVIALWFRLTIIESPRYTADVGRDSKKAAAELAAYLPSQESIRTSSSSVDVITEMHGLTQRHGSSEDGTTLQNLSGGNSGAPPQAEDDLEDISFVDVDEVKAPPPPSWKDFKEYFWHAGNLRTLFATSFCWFCVDLPFYGLGMNSPKIISTIWYGPKAPPTDIYTFLVHNVWQSLVVVSLGAIIGCIVTFVAIDKLGRRNIQLIGFFWLFVLFIVIGASFNHLYETNQTSATIVLYILCQIFFNFGPNTITYILPAELFPTRYRALCHGISAAFGKLGSVAAQLFLAYINYGESSVVNYNNGVENWLRNSLLILSVFMLLGFLLTLFYIPAHEHNSSGAVKSLEELEIGRGPNGFGNTFLARRIAPVWRAIARAWDGAYLWLDKVTDGDLAERRQREMEEREEVSVRRDC